MPFVEQKDMIDSDLQTELLKLLDQLVPLKQWQVLHYARSLTDASRKGVPGDQLLQFAGTMTHEEAREFLKGIERE
jgi:hypothetical protein